jgi:hypothetical protein
LTVSTRQIDWLAISRSAVAGIIVMCQAQLLIACHSPSPESPPGQQHAQVTQMCLGWVRLLGLQLQGASEPPAPVCLPCVQPSAASTDNSRTTAPHMTIARHSSSLWILSASLVYTAILHHRQCQDIPAVCCHWAGALGQALAEQSAGAASQLYVLLGMQPVSTPGHELHLVSM